MLDMKSAVCWVIIMRWHWIKSRQTSCGSQCLELKVHTSTHSKTSQFFYLEEYRNNLGGNDGVCYLYTQGNDIGKSGEWFDRVDSLQSRINHFGECVNIMQLWSGPPNQWFLCPWPRAACIKTTQKITLKECTWTKTTPKKQGSFFST